MYYRIAIVENNVINGPNWYVCSQLVTFRIYSNSTIAVGSCAQKTQNVPKFVYTFDKRLTEEKQVA